MKLSLLDLFENYFGPGRPEGPSEKNKHHFNKYPKIKGLVHYPQSSNYFPYVNPKEDLEDKEEQVEQPELSELFNFMTPARDNTTFSSHDTQGSGMSNVPSKSYTDFEFPSNKTRKKQKKENRKSGNEARAQKVLEITGPDLAHRFERDETDYSTKDGWRNGLPRDGSDFDPESEIDKEERSILKYIEDMAENFSHDAVSDHAKLANKRIAHDKADLYALDDKDNLEFYIMNTEEDFKDKK